jgi:uncharacterized DUF497 family protein
VAGQFQYQFEWDPRKARVNLKRHGIAFERSATIFLDRSALSEFDEAHSEAEERWITMGLDHTGVLLVVCHTFRDDTESTARLRLISARKASKGEAAEYERRKVR